MRKQKATAYTEKKEIDQTGYNRLVESLEQMQKELQDIRKQRRSVINNDGTNFAESPSFLYLIALENSKHIEIEALKEKINSYIVVDKKTDTDFISFDDQFTVEITYPDSEPEIKKYKLVGSSPDLFQNEISQDSAIGSFVKGKTVGDSGDLLLPDGSHAFIKIIYKE